MEYRDHPNNSDETSSSGPPTKSFEAYDTTHAEATSSLTTYPANPGSSWQSYQDVQGPPSSNSITSTYPAPSYSSEGYYATANPFDFPFQGTTTTSSASYGGGPEVYGYAYQQQQQPQQHQGQPVTSPITAGFPLDNSMGSVGKKTVASSSSTSKKQKESSSRKKSKHFTQSPASASSSSTTSKSKLRSASRTSKNTHHNPPATEEERKNRESHNQVEKQYRNRLNTHFESLLNALPESLRSGDPDDEGGGLDISDRRVSKAEVLDMARRHIKALERECAQLESERDELRENMERLRYLFGRCEGGSGAGAGAAGTGGDGQDFQGQLAGGLPGS